MRSDQPHLAGRWRGAVAAGAAVALALSMTIAARQVSPSGGEWAMFRGAPALDGNASSPLP